MGRHDISKSGPPGGAAAYVSRDDFDDYDFDASPVIAMRLRAGLNVAHETGGLGR